MENEIEVLFEGGVINTQKLGSDNEHMVSKLNFKIDDVLYTCEIRQPYGEDSTFEEYPIEVTIPQSLKNVLPYEDFREKCEEYYRKIVGPNASLIRVRNSKDIGIENCSFEYPHTASVKKITSSGGW